MESIIKVLFNLGNKIKGLFLVTLLCFQTSGNCQITRSMSASGVWNCICNIHVPRAPQGSQHLPGPASLSLLFMLLLLLLPLGGAVGFDRSWTNLYFTCYTKHHWQWKAELTSSQLPIYFGYIIMPLIGQCPGLCPAGRYFCLFLWVSVTQ